MNNRKKSAFGFTSNNFQIFQLISIYDVKSLKFCIIMFNFTTYCCNYRIGHPI